MADYGKAVRIEIEWEDGTIQKLTGEQAERYLRLEKTAFYHARNQGVRVDPLPWTVTPPARPRTAPPPSDPQSAPASMKRGMRLVCSVCREVQFLTAAGLTCSNGHGGAPSAEEL